ncbi:protein EMSY-LIKE 3 isoform X2 [Manihot esculenta]|uniref:Uncharacterized protein n=1 Tax=Manihot esculenta TaxID=3983 RepID=A0ACB7H744_MANES|nr:protein EMSY-LIKE 3 isoform X2 [Manihot esculenta]KAG8648001.1 hypothetical protein MANES_09G136700v8 [Manihot esculenta]
MDYHRIKNDHTGGTCDECLLERKSACSWGAWYNGDILDPLVYIRALKKKENGSRGQIMMRNVKSPPYAHSSGAPRASLLEPPCGTDDKDINFQIHSMEKEAYSSVLRAFNAQSDLLSWGKEWLITELRKELNVTDTEHGQLLVKINSDESIKRIREWQKHAHKSLSAKLDNSGPIDSVDDTPQEKRPLKSQKYVLYHQPSLARIPLLAQTHYKDNQQRDELAVLSSVQSMKVVDHNFSGPLSNKGGPAQSHSKTGFHVAGSSKFKNHSQFIKIRATDEIILEVERMAYGREDPDPVQLEKAKLILRDHEKAILGALDKLADVVL